jgi:putative aldouronate transport system substrate-binding protein
MKKNALTWMFAAAAVLLAGSCSRSNNSRVEVVERASPEKIDVLNQPEKLKVRVAALAGYTLPNSRTQKWLEERYNIEIEIMPLPGAADAPAKISLLMADDRERPDIIWWSGMEADFSRWRDAGLLVDLTDYVHKYTNMRDYYDSQDPSLLFFATSDEGRIYRIPGDVAESGSQTLWIRKDWLDNLGLGIPTTLAELEDVLYKFTFNDPDGNGQNDTYGLAGQGNTYTTFWPWIQGSAAGRGTTAFQFVVMEDGSYAFSGATEDTKKWVDRVTKLMQDKVVNPNVVLPTTNGTEEMARGGFGVINRWVAWNNPSSVPMRSFYSTNPGALWIPIEMVSGDNNNPQDVPSNLSAWCYFGITKNAPDPERLYALWDDMAAPEPYIIKRFGIEGEEYTKNSDGSYEILISGSSNENFERNIGIDMFHDLFARKDWCNISNHPDTVKLFERSGKMSRDAYSIGIEKKNPNMYTVWNEYGAELVDIRDAYIWSVIGGTDSLDNWDRYIANLRANGLDQVLDELQEYYPAQEEERRAYLRSRGF